MEDILLGTTDRTILVFIPDPASTTGAGKTGLAAGDITCTYTRVETDNDVAHTDVTSSLNNLTTLSDAHNDWGWKEVSATLSKGLYRLDIADAVFASGAWYAVVQVTITTGTAAATPKAFRLVARNDLDGVRLGLTALPNAAADGAGGLPISDAGGLDLDTFLGRITGNVALASVLGALNDAAVDGDPTTSDTVMQYVKQVVNTLVGSAGIPTFPAAAAPANGVSLAEAIRKIYDDLGAGGGLDAAGVRAAIGMSSANMDVQLDGIADFFTDNRGEPAQGAPAASTDPLSKLDFLYKLARNKITQDATTLRIFADDATTVDHKATVSDNGTTYTRNEITSGP